MKKSPLSMPSGSKAKQCNNWKLYEKKSWSGYNYGNDDNYQCASPNGVQMHTGNDFIPLNISTPVSDKKRHSGNWHGSGGGARNHRNSGSGGFNHYRNNYHATTKSNYNNSYSPYKHSGKQFHGQKKSYQKETRRQIDISNYIDMRSFLEDPWAELVKRLSKSEESKGVNSSKIDQSNSSQNMYDVTSKPGSEITEMRDANDSFLSQESKHDSSVEGTFGLDDTDVSDVSRTDSSINIQLDSVRFSEESRNESFCSNNDTAETKNTEKDTEFRGDERASIEAVV